MTMPSLLNDILFKIVFGTEGSEVRTRHLINALLNLQGTQRIQQLQILNPALHKSHLLEKGAVLDVMAQDNDGKLYNIEVQLQPGDAYVNRSVYYLSRLYTSQLKSGHGYRTLLKTVGISLLDFVLLPNLEPAHNRFILHDPDRDFTLTDILELHTIELPKIKPTSPDELNTPFDRWIHVLRFGHQYEELNSLPANLLQEEGVTNAMETMKNAYARDDVRDLMEARQKWEHDQISYRIAACEEAAAQGHAEGLAAGHAKGLAEGHAEGHAEGQAEARLQMAQKLREMGLTPEQIAQATELP